MNKRGLSDSESKLLLRFRDAASDFTLIYLTETGLRKSILDATIPLRELMKRYAIHDYEAQGQGPESKRFIEVHWLSEEESKTLQTSLYRPLTKAGDPRIWFSGLSGLANPDDVLVFFVSRDTPFVANITQLSASGVDSGCWLASWLDERRIEAFTVAMELLTELRRIAANGPLPATCTGDTAIGRAIETALGIPMNSRKAPDFMGIEIKSKRSSGGNTRHTLFAQVPDWNLSNCKSSREILNLFGYERQGQFKLYCEVSMLRPNSQGLQFRISKSPERLVEFTKQHPNVAVWTLDKLHARLLEKHPETFWIRARSEKRNGIEWFFLEQVAHTRKPSVAQFDELLSLGVITMDHLIKKKGNGAQEKGPLFKIDRERLNDLFLSPAVTYSLI